MVLLIHHPVGKNVRHSTQNVARVMAGVHRVLRPGGKLIIVESCVPRWFYFLEKLLFPVVAPLVDRLLSHPMTLQYPARMLARMLGEVTHAAVSTTLIPKGRWVLQFGFVSVRRTQV